MLCQRKIKIECSFEFIQSSKRNGTGNDQNHILLISFVACRKVNNLNHNIFITKDAEGHRERHTIGTKTSMTLVGIIGQNIKNRQRNKALLTAKRRLATCIVNMSKISVPQPRPDQDHWMVPTGTTGRSPQNIWFP